MLDGRLLVLHDGRHKWIRVDLAMGMAQRDADRLAAVLEDVHVSDVSKAAELVGAVAPDLDEVLDVLDRLFAQR